MTISFNNRDNYIKQKLKCLDKYRVCFTTVIIFNAFQKYSQTLKSKKHSFLFSVHAENLNLENIVLELQLKVQLTDESKEHQN